MQIGLAMALCAAIAMTAGCGKNDRIHEAMPVPGNAPVALPAAIQAKVAKRPVMIETSSHTPMSEAELARQILEVLSAGNTVTSEQADYGEPEPAGNEKILQAELIQ